VQIVATGLAGRLRPGLAIRHGLASLVAPCGQAACGARAGTVSTPITPWQHLCSQRRCWLLVPLASVGSAHGRSGARSGQTGSEWRPSLSSLTKSTSACAATGLGPSHVRRERRSRLERLRGERASTPARARRTSSANQRLSRRSYCCASVCLEQGHLHCSRDAVRPTRTQYPPNLIFRTQSSKRSIIAVNHD